jgi:plasmid maintenance system antidote protein VapI
MAIRLDNAFGIGLEELMTMQNGCNIEQALNRWDDVDIAVAA